MAWRYLAYRYACGVALYNLLRSSRTPDEPQVARLLALFLLLGNASMAAHARWWLTGRRPPRWLLRTDLVVVEPFPRLVPVWIARRAWDGYIERGKESYGDPAPAFGRQEPT